MLKFTWTSQRRGTIPRGHGELLTRVEALVARRLQLRDKSTGATGELLDQLEAQAGPAANETEYLRDEVENYSKSWKSPRRGSRSPYERSSQGQFTALRKMKRLLNCVSSLTSNAGRP